MTEHAVAAYRSRYVAGQQRSTITCSCGKKVHSRRGFDGATQAYAKHVQRAEAKEPLCDIGPDPARK